MLGPVQNREPVLHLAGGNQPSSNLEPVAHGRRSRDYVMFVELRRGPPAGTRVAVKGAAFTLDGDKVKIAMATGH